VKQTGWAELLAHDLPRLVLLCVGVWLNAADSLVTATIMPSVARDIGGYAVFAWGVAGFMLGAVVATASAGRLSERLGLRAGMACSAGVYVLGCVLSAVAPDIFTFLLGRLVQGVGAGWILGLCFVAVRVSFPEALWAKVFAAIAAVWGVATVLGPLVGGLFASHWRLAFWAFAAQAAVFGVAAPLGLKRDTPRQGASGNPSGGHPSGGLATAQLAALGASTLLIAVAGVLARPLASAGLVVAGLALLGLMLRLDARAKVQLLPRAACDLRTVTGSGYAMIFCLFTSTTVFGVFGPALLQAIDGLSPLEAGYVIATDSIGWTITALAVSNLQGRREDQAIRGGTIAITLGMAALALTLPHRSIAAVVAAGLLLGSGFGLMWSLASRRILASVAEAEAAIGSSALPTLQGIGGITGAALAGVLANLLGLAKGFDASAAAHAAPWLFGALTPIAGLGVLAAIRLTSRTPELR
jgi:MFS family permease